MMKCADEMNVDLKSKDVEKDPKFKCLFKCMLEKDGIIKDDTLEEEELIKEISEDKDLEAGDRDKAVKAVPKCMDEAKSKSDLCEKSYDVTMCIYKLFE